MTAHNRTSRIPSFLLDTRIIAILGQIAFVVLLVASLYTLGSGMFEELARRDISPTFTFLTNRAGFELSDAGTYTPDDTYLEAFKVGVVNTLRVVSVGLVLTTILGVLVGIFLLSGNWLVRNIAQVYVEILRNTPLLVQLFVWFYVILLTLPVIRDSLQFPPAGITVIPLRWLVFVVAVPIIARFTRGLPAESLTRMLVPILAVGAMIVAESLRLLHIPLLRLELSPIAYLSNRGIALPAVIPTAHFDEWLVFVIVGIALAVVVSVLLKRRTERRERRYPRMLYALAVVLLAAVVGWVVVRTLPVELVTVERDGQTVAVSVEEAIAQELIEPDAALAYSPSPVAVSIPQRQGLRYAQGLVMLPEYSALLLGLVVYTSAFIAEVVRAGIQAVPRGQIEASRALGFSYVDSLRLIVLPQALRVIIPPLSNQYLNLAKNSSLAIAISFTDVFQVTGTIINQTGQSVSGILMVMGVYLVMSLVIAFVMNLVNRRFQLVTR